LLIANSSLSLAGGRLAAAIVVSLPASSGMWTIPVPVTSFVVVPTTEYVDFLYCIFLSM